MRSGFFLPPRIRKKTINKTIPHMLYWMTVLMYPYLWVFFLEKNCFCVYLTETQYLLLGNNLIKDCLTFCGNKGSFPSFPVEILITSCNKKFSY